MRTILRLIGRGIADIALHPLANMLSITAMTLAVFLGGIFLFALTTIDRELHAVQDEAVWQVFWKPDANMKVVAAQWDDMRALPSLLRMETWTPEQAWESLSEELQQKSLRTNLKDSPLPATALLVFAPKDVDVTQWEQETRAKLEALPSVAVVTATPLKDEFARVWRGMSMLVIWPSVIFLALVLALVSASSVRLVLAQRREEIAILRLVGAKTWYIRLPLLVSGAFIGLLGGGMACALLTMFYVRVGHLISLPPLLHQIHVPPIEQAVLLFCVPIVMGLLGGWVAVRGRG